jgi:DNA-binding protein YbaB
MTSQPLLDFIHTLPAFIATAPPVIGVSNQAKVKVVLQLDRQLTNIFIDSQLLPSPLDLRSKILEAINEAQELRNRQVQAMISQHSHVAKLSLWDVEGTLLAIRSQQDALAVNFQGIGCNRLVSVVRGQQGQIDRLVLNSLRVVDRHELELAIVAAAQDGYEKVRRLQKILPFPHLSVV